VILEEKERITAPAYMRRSNVRHPTLHHANRINSIIFTLIINTRKDDDLRLVHGPAARLVIWTKTRTSST